MDTVDVCVHVDVHGNKKSNYSNNQENSLIHEPPPFRNVAFTKIPRELLCNVNTTFLLLTWR